MFYIREREERVNDLLNYIRTIIEPTVDDFRHNPASVRHAFIACVVIFHAVDYKSYPKSSRGLRGRWRKMSPDFALVDKVAHAFKHVAVGNPSAPDLMAKQVFARPPALFGQMAFGLSRFGDPVGAVIADGQELFPVVTRCVEFLHQQVNE